MSLIDEAWAWGLDMEQLEGWKLQIGVADWLQPQLIKRHTSCTATVSLVNRGILAYRFNLCLNACSIKL